jgi:hypothetical protein
MIVGYGAIHRILITPKLRLESQIFQYQDQLEFHVIVHNPKRWKFRPQLPKCQVHVSIRHSVDQKSELDSFPLVWEQNGQESISIPSPEHRQLRFITILSQGAILVRRKDKYEGPDGSYIPASTYDIDFEFDVGRRTIHRKLKNVTIPDDVKTRSLPAFISDC